MTIIKTDVINIHKAYKEALMLQGYERQLFASRQLRRLGAPEPSARDQMSTLRGWLSICQMLLRRAQVIVEEWVRRAAKEGKDVGFLLSYATSKSKWKASSPNQVFQVHHT